MARLKKHVGQGAGAALMLVSMASAALAAPAAPLDQGVRWGPAERKAFYSLYQGSQLMPERWFLALRRTNDAPFAASLASYGYLPNPTPGATLPIGFTTGRTQGDKATSVGMTCAACHTRQIEVKGKAYIVDGGPALVDFQTFLSDLDAAVARTLADGAVFKRFAAGVIGSPPTPEQLATLRSQVETWHKRNHTLMQASLPKKSPWGVGRADAIQMIFNRLTGLDLGAGEDDVNPANIKLADAPVRYPFLWYASKQNKTQWLGFAPNGNAITAVLRNMGQVYGVFARFHPEKEASGDIKYWRVNSVDTGNLYTLEGLIKRLEAPAWPGPPLDPDLQAKGKVIFQTKGECSSCHETPWTAQPTRAECEMNPAILGAWQTPVCRVGTDTRQGALMTRTADPGILLGAGQTPLKNPDTALNILRVAVFESWKQRPLPITESDKGAFEAREFFAKPQAGYEARRLRGVWAAAPYLHNGSVPTLAQLLTPPKDRVSSFDVGREYDLDDVGLAKVQSGLRSTMKAGCTAANLNSGNSSCGHDYGTTLTAAEKKALIEYLKTY